jgi:hypothetical protein
MVMNSGYNNKVIEKEEINIHFELEMCIKTWTNK